MAFELAVYVDERKVVVHQSTCHTYSTVAREYQTSPIVKVPEGWKVVKCSSCKPNLHTVNSVRRRIHAISPPPPMTEDEKHEALRHPASRLSYWNRGISRNNPDSSFPPYGVVALDITHSENRKTWWREAECHSEDEKLGEWLQWLFQGDHTEHWTTTVQKVMCAQCPVRAECLEQGVWGFETWGVWGGATERERKLLREKWLKEGRIDERPERPHGYGSNTITVRSTNGSRDTTPRDSDGPRTDEESRAYEAASEDMQEVFSGREVRWPRSYAWSDHRWGGESDSYRGGSWETGGFGGGSFRRGKRQAAQSDDDADGI